MKRPRWVSVLAVAFALFGLLLAGGALSLFQRVEVDNGGWFPGLAQGLDREIAKLLIVLATCLIVSSIGIWRAPRVAMRITGSLAIGASLLPFIFRYLPVSLINVLESFLAAGLALLTLGSLGIIVRVALFSFGAAIIFYSRDTVIEQPASNTHAT